jgi:hypothetical protein
MANNVNSRMRPWSAAEKEGFAKTYNAGVYDIANLCYPADLMQPTYGGNFAIFYINVSTDSKLIKNKEAEVVLDSDVEPRMRGDLVGLQMTKNSLMGANLAVNAITNVGKVAGAAIGGAAAAKGAGAGKYLAGVVGGVAGAATAAAPAVGMRIAATQASSATRSQRRLKAAIALHVPNQLSVRYGMQWSDEDTINIQMAHALGSDVYRALTDSAGSKNVDLTDDASAAVANVMLRKGPEAGANSAALGIASNPKKEQVFKGVDFRTFQFEYQFFPRNSAESQNVQEIVHMFKLHMHPEFKDSNNFVYVYPSEFDIAYYTNGKENMKLHRHTSCVLTEMSVNYTPSGSFSTFADGTPTQINIQMTFRELQLLTKDSVREGL